MATDPTMEIWPQDKILPDELAREWIVDGTLHPLMQLPAENLEAYWTLAVTHGKFEMVFQHHQLQQIDGTRMQTRDDEVWVNFIEQRHQEMQAVQDDFKVVTIDNQCILSMVCFEFLDEQVEVAIRVQLLRQIQDQLTVTIRAPGDKLLAVATVGNLAGLVTGILTQPPLRLRMLRVECAKWNDLLVELTAVLGPTKFNFNSDSNRKVWFDVSLVCGMVVRVELF